MCRATVPCEVHAGVRYAHVCARSLGLPMHCPWSVAALFWPPHSAHSGLGFAWFFLFACASRSNCARLELHAFSEKCACRFVCVHMCDTRACLCVHLAMHVVLHHACAHMLCHIVHDASAHGDHDAVVPLCLNVHVCTCVVMVLGLARLTLAVDDFSKYVRERGAQRGRRIEDKEKLPNQEQGVKIRSGFDWLPSF